jgi:hypothetical protein
LPLLVSLLPPALGALRTGGRLAFVLAVCLSMAIPPRNVPTVRDAALTGAAPVGDGSSLAAASGAAAGLLRFHQQRTGPWLTAHTATQRFERPRPELNTYLTAMIVDLLDPVAPMADLGTSLSLASAFLGSQIEPSGLVRYHGRPDGAALPSLGCVITPDADDTALGWRLAGGNQRALLGRALGALAQYRTPEGLYRTWLAPRDGYECIDPGKDPNPTDVGIQMHVLLFLAKFDPPSVPALCSALRSALDEDRIWVYYRLAPLVPMLRQADLRHAGCLLRIPEARLRTEVAGQEVWMTAGRLLERLTSEDESLPSSAETQALLRTLSDDGFSAIRRNPPLLYHNDLTARSSSSRSRGPSWASSRPGASFPAGSEGLSCSFRCTSSFRGARSRRG